MTPEATQYATDHSGAEKALDGPGSRPDSQQCPLGTVEDPQNGAQIAAKEHDESDELDFRPDAKVWHLYLMEAEHEAKERAELWRTGLDAVLIFAGLFAGIVSAFVIDVRKDLEADSEQRLLTSINLILSEQPPPQNRIPPISIAMSGLWNISLYITLFAAMMGASAKAWLAAYIPVSMPHDAKGAFHRYRLDQHAERWCLQEVIASAPLLIQFALGLFLVGLILQNFLDNRVLGVLLLLFFVSGGILYFLLTIHPWGTPSSPYNTAISGPLMWLALGLPSKGKKNPPDVEIDINKGLADILYTRLLKSPNPAFVDEAIAEIALPGFKSKWIDYLCKSDTPLVVLKRLRQCVAVGQIVSDESSRRFYNILVVFLRFLEHYEAKAAPCPEGDYAGECYGDLIDALRQLSALDSHTHHLGRLRNLSGGVDILLLSLSVNLDCGAPYHETNRNLSPPWDLEWCGLDVLESNLKLSDWPREGNYLKRAACRAVFTNNQQHMKAGARVLTAALVSVVACSPGGSGSTRTTQTHPLKGGHWEDASRHLSFKCLAELYEIAANEWRGMSHSCGQSLGKPDRLKEQRRHNRRKASRSTTLSIYPENPSDGVASTFSMLAEEEEDRQVRLIFQHFARGQIGQPTRAIIQDTVRSVCATILNSYPEDRIPVTHALAFLYSKHRELLEELEDVSTVHGILPLILHDLSSEAMETSGPENQTSLLRMLSTLAKNSEVRRDIILHLLYIKPAPQYVLECNLELLIRLINDGRLAHDPTDFVMLLSASQLATGAAHPEPYHSRILEALGSRYASNAFKLNAVKHDQLSDWFLLAVLGQRATVQEVSSWISRCQLWLAEGKVAKKLDCTTGDI